MKQFIFLLCLATAAAANPLFHCGPDGPLNVTTSLSDFRLTTRSDKHSSYSSDIICEFNAESPNAAFLLEVESFDVVSAVLSISSGDKLLFRGSILEKHQTSIVTPSRRLRIRFDAAGDLWGSCFGTSSTSGRLNFFDAQRACNNMRANLLHLPSYYSGNIGRLMRDLPRHLSSYYAWISFTDRADR